MEIEIKLCIYDNETTPFNLRSPDNLICPLCGSEIEEVWAVTEKGCSYKDT